ncbi:hypothetical protein [Coleofasciculus sp.]
MNPGCDSLARSLGCTGFGEDRGKVRSLIANYHRVRQCRTPTQSIIPEMG